MKTHMWINIQMWGEKDPDLYTALDSDVLAPINHCEDSEADFNAFVVKDGG